MILKKKNSAALKSPHLWLPLIGVAILGILLLLLSYVNSGSFVFRWNYLALIREGRLILLQMIITIYFVYYTIRYFDKKYVQAFSIKRYIYEIVLVALVGFVINQVFHFLFIKFVVVPEANEEELTVKLHNLLLVSQTLVLIIYILITGFRILKNLQKKQMELLKLQKEFAQTQFEALKNQLNPHFLFNSLSVLTSLVYSDAGKAETFIEKLSKTYRYLLDQREKEAVDIGSEVAFLGNFEYLIQQRYGNKVIIKKEIPDRINNLFLLPHTMLIVFEYIIGSNTMSAAKPLQVEITVKNNFLLIRYSHQPKELPAKHLLDQFKSLLENYNRVNKEILVSIDEFSQQQIIRIPLLST